MTAGTLVELARVFAGVSLLGFGGMNTVLPEIHREAVDIARWITDRQFADLYALSQAEPGPNSFIATLIGYQAAGVAGAVVSTMAVCLPPAALAYLVARVWGRIRGTAWRAAIQAGLTPVMVGLMASSAFILIRAADHSATAFAVTAATAALAYTTNINPLWAFAVAGLLGAAGVF
ncbi:MAG TPA: chromate transporter [bacterium]|nr:chromate transporter [bacterium]